MEISAKERFVVASIYAREPTRSRQQIKHIFRSRNGKSIFDSNLVNCSTINTYSPRAILFRSQKSWYRIQAQTVMNITFPASAFSTLSSLIICSAVGRASPGPSVRSCTAEYREVIAVGGWVENVRKKGLGY